MALVAYRLIGEGAPKDPVPVDKELEQDFVIEARKRGFAPEAVIPYDIQAPQDPITGKTKGMQRVFVHPSRKEEFAAESVKRGYLISEQPAPFEAPGPPALPPPPELSVEGPSTPEGVEIRNRITFRQAMTANAAQAKAAKSNRDAARALGATAGRVYDMGLTAVGGIMDNLAVAASVPMTVGRNIRNAILAAGSDPNARPQGVESAISSPYASPIDRLMAAVRGARAAVADETELARAAVGDLDRETLQEGGIAALAGQRIGGEAAKMALRLAGIKKLTGSQIGENVGRGRSWAQGARDTARQAATLGVVEAGLTPGGVKEKLRSGGVMAAGIATPILSSLAPTDAAAIVADIAVNSGVSLAAGSYTSAIEEAKQLAESRGDANWKKYLVVTLTPTVLNDVVTSLNTRAAQGDQAAKATVETMEQRAKQFTQQQAAEQARIDAENALAEEEAAGVEDAPPAPKQSPLAPPTPQSTVGSTEPKIVATGPAISAQPEVVSREQAAPAGKPKRGGKIGLSDQARIENPLAAMVEDNGGLKRGRPDPQTGVNNLDDYYKNVPLRYRRKNGIAMDEAHRIAIDEGLVNPDSTLDDFVRQLSAKRPRIQRDRDFVPPKDYVEPPKVPVAASDLRVGDEFTIDGESFKVAEETDTAVRVKDGRDYWLPYDETDRLAIDKDSYKSAPESFSLERQTPQDVEADRATAEATARKEAMLDEQAAPLKVRGVDTTGDLFDPSKADAPLFAAPTPKPQAAPTARGIDLAKLSAPDAARVAELQRAFIAQQPAKLEDDAMRAFDYAMRAVDPNRIDDLPKIAQSLMNKRAGRTAAREARTESVQDAEAVGRPIEAVERLPSEQAEITDAATRMTAALEKLPEAQRNAFKAVAVDGETMAAYAKRSGLAVSTVQKRVEAARQKLRADAKKMGMTAEDMARTLASASKPASSDAVKRLDELADEALQRIMKRRSEGRVMMGVDPADVRDYAIYGAAKIMKGVVRFAEWAKEMKSKFGDGIEPRLKAIYDESKRIAGITSKAKSRDEIDAQAAAMFPGKVIGRTAERAAESAKIPKFDEGVKTKAAAWHKPMNLGEVKTRIDAMTPEQLVAESNKPVGDVSEDATQNVRLAAWGKRYQNAMDDFKAETDPARIEQKRAVLEDLAAEFSRASGGVGQAMRVMREFYETTPAGRIMLMSRSLSKQGLRMSDAALKNMTGHIEKMDAVEERIAKAERALIDNPDNAAAYKELEAAEQSLKDVIRNMNQTIHETMEPNLARMLVASLQGGYIRIPTLLNNYLYNVFATPIFSLEHYLSAGIDRARSVVGRQERLIRTPMAKGRVRALKDAASESWEILRRGYGTSNVPGPAGERTSNMKPFVALRQLIDFARGRPSTLPVDKKTGKVTPKTLALKGAETVLGSIHALKLRALAPGDVAFRTPRKEAALREYYWNKGLRGSKLDAAVRTPDPVALRRADIDSAERVFQEDNAVAQAINKYFFGGVERAGKAVGGSIGEAAAAVGVRATTTPFVKTLINVNRFFVELGLPPVPAAEAIYFATRAGQAHRKADAASDGYLKKQLRAQAEEYTIAAEKKTARAIVGLGVFGITSALAGMGVLVGTPPSNEAERKIGYARGGWMRMNVSALKRALAGGDAAWQSGDYTVDLQKVGPLGQVLIAHADAKRAIDKMRKKMTIGEAQEGGAALYTKALLSNMVAASLNSSMAKDINMALDTLKSADQKKLSTWFGQRFANTLAMFLPNDLIAAGQAKDPVLRDPTGEGFGENVKRGVQLRTFNTEDVPEQLDMFGRTIPSTGDKDDDVMDRIVDRFFNPLALREIKPDAETDFVNKVADAAGDDRRAYPPRVQRTIKVDGNEYALSEPLWLERQKAVGAERVKAVQSVMQYASGEMSEQKAKTIAKTLDIQYERARERADAQFVARLKQEYPDALRNTKP